MTNKNNSNIKRILIFAISFLMIICLMFSGLAACKKDDSKSEETKYKYSYPTEKYLSNPSFSNDLENKSLDLYPISSATGWEKTYHNSAISSHVDSGVIDASKDGWDKLMEKLKADDDLISALANQYKDELIASSENSVEDESQAKTYIKENLEDFYIDRTLVSSSNDKHMYLINNYPQNAAYSGTTTGTAQRIKSSSKVTVGKGKYAKISVYVKTKNITSQGDPLNAGANINLIPTFNTKTMGEFRLSSIKVEDWTKYTIYVKGDSNYSTSFSLALGLGYGEGANTLTKYYTQGTALFDEVTVEILDNLDGVTIDSTTTLNYNQTENYQINAIQGKTNYLFDMTLDLPTSFPENYFSKLNATFPTNSNDLFTTSNVSSNDASSNITSKNISSDSRILATYTNDIYKLDLLKASASIKIESPDFVMDFEQYKIVSFKIKNNLKDFGSQKITIDVIDIDGDTQSKRPAVVKFDHTSDKELTCNLIIKNNFETGSQNRQFKIVIVVGPTALTDVKYASDLATGSVEFSNFYVAEGSITDKESETYEFYSLINETANGTTDLYAGYENLPSEEETSKTFSIVESPSDYGTITRYPANPKDYEGVDSNHVYVKTNGVNTSINAHTGKGLNGNFAGLINSKYKETYKQNLSGVNLDLAFASEDEEIQPLMIYNKNSSSYGFISNTKTISASSYAKVSLKVKVDSSAKAYIYLIDVSKSEKTPLTLNSFTPLFNDDITTYGEYTNTTKLETVLTVDANTKKDVNGWADINFFIATGASSKTFRLEIWNGGRDGSDATKSSGLVLFDNINITTSSAFVESKNCNSALYESTSPLYAKNIGYYDSDQLFAYQRPLTETEKSFNADYPDQAISYSPNYVWAKTPTMIFAVYNTIDPQETDPYASITEEEESNNCASETDPSTFWLSFSSILLIVALLASMIMLIVKKVVRKRKANANDAKSHYKVTSRVTKDIKNDKPKKLAKQEAIVEAPAENEVEELNEQTEEEYQYSDVQDFGNDDTLNG